MRRRKKGARRKKRRVHRHKVGRQGHLIKVDRKREREFHFGYKDKS